MRVAPTQDAGAPKRAKYAVVPRELVENPALSDAACRLFTALDSITLGYKAKQVTLQRLAEQMGWSRSKMTRARKELEAAGLIETHRTFRSPKVTVRNPVRDRAAAHNGTSGTTAEPKSDASPVTHKPSENPGNCVTSEAPSCVTSEAPIQEYRKENNKQSSSGVPARALRGAVHNATAVTAPEKTAATILAAGEIENYLSAIAERTGHMIEANKLTGPLIATIADRGISPQDTAQLVDAQLAAAGNGVKNPSGFIVKVVLPALAEKPIKESPKPTPTPPTVAELTAAKRCNHGAEIGKCAVCRTEQTANAEAAPKPSPAENPAPAKPASHRMVAPSADWCRVLSTVLDDIDVNELPAHTGALLQLVGPDRFREMYGASVGTAA
jgi:hypothetical protein